MKLRILGFNYSLFSEDGKGILKNRMGLTDFDHQIIYINNEMSLDMQVSTLIHEVIEAINFHTELNMKHKQISGIEAGIYQVLADNGFNLESVMLGAIKESEEEEVLSI